MRQITEISTSANQRLRLVGENNEQIDLVLQYKPTQQSWYFTLTYQGRTIGSKRVCESPNLLNQFRNVVPFGLACRVPEGGEPYFVEDFATGRVQLYLLNEAERDQATTIFETRST